MKALRIDRHADDGHTAPADERAVGCWQELQLAYPDEADLSVASYELLENLGSNLHKEPSKK